MAISQHVTKAVRLSRSTSIQMSGHKRKARLIIGSMKYTNATNKKHQFQMDLIYYRFYNLTSEESQELHNDVHVD